MDDAIPRPSWKLALVKWLSITALIAWPLLCADNWTSHGCIEMPAERAWRYTIFGLAFPLEIIYIGRKWYRLSATAITAGILLYLASPMLVDFYSNLQWLQFHVGLQAYPWRDYLVLVNDIMPNLSVVLIVLILLFLIKRIAPATREFIVITLLFPLTMLLGFELNVIFAR